MPNPRPQRISRLQSTCRRGRSPDSRFAIRRGVSSGCSNSAAVSCSTSPNRHFGGISALRVQPDGARFISLTDKGWWFRGRLVYDGTRPAGITDAEMAPILGADGRPLAARGWYDTEAIAQDGGTLYVGIERVNQIVRFNYGKDGLRARGTPIAVPPGCEACPTTRASNRWSSCRRGCRSPAR